MSILQLTSEEERILTEVLERSNRDLEVEVAHTDSHEFKAMLKQRREAIQGVLNRLQRPAMAA